MAKHFYNEHQAIVDTSTANQEDLVTASRLGSGGIKSNMTRFLQEAIEIEEQSSIGDINMVNGRGEWGRVTLTRLALTEQ